MSEKRRHIARARRWSVFPLSVLLALAASGCGDHFVRFEEQPTVYGVVRPLAVAGGTALDHRLEMDDKVGWEVGATIPLYGGEFMYALCYLPMEEENTGQEVDLYWIDYGAGARVPFWESNGPPPLFLHFDAGWSFLYMDPDEDHRMGGMGGFARVGLGTCFGRHAGIEVFAEAHGWLGFDAEGFQAADQRGLGFKVFVAF